MPNAVLGVTVVGPAAARNISKHAPKDESHAHGRGGDECSAYQNSAGEWMHANLQIIALLYGLCGKYCRGIQCRDRV